MNSLTTSFPIVLSFGLCSRDASRWHRPPLSPLVRRWSA
jgi:hypothetical protein